MIYSFRPSGRALLLATLSIMAAVFVGVSRRGPIASTPASSGVCQTGDTSACQAEPAPSRTANANLIEKVLIPHLFEALSPIQQEIFIARLDALYNQPLPTAPLAMLCFAPDTPQLVVEAFTLLDEFPRYNQTTRWSSTASGSTGSQGDPITLTYGFPADGVTIPVISGVSYPAGPNSLNAWLNSIYGSQATWKPLFDLTFARWSQLSGVTYIYEPNDDGATMNQNQGVLGVRADLRIGAKTLDGNSGVLAYNNFPPDGDMVFDAFDSFFEDTSSASLRLRNVISHEHGHGTGQLHVCPIQQTKLMEPFVSTAYDGPRHDDVRNMQRFYGDPFEPDNDPINANDLGDLVIGNSFTVGNVPAPSLPNGSLLSIDANGEQDYFFFEVASEASINVTVTPIGTSYDDSDQACSGQSGSCCSGNTIDSLAIADLNVDVIGPNGVTVLATGNSAAAGSSEVLTGVPLQNPAGYFIRVYEGNSPTQSQLYKLTVTIGAPVFAPLTIQLPSGAPSALIGGQPTSFGVVIDPGDESLVNGTAILHYRYEPGAFSQVALTPEGGNNFTATLPAPGCDATPEFYLSATGSTTGQVTLPSAGPAAPFTAVIPVPLIDDFQTDQGWSVTNAPSGGTFDGAWQRGIPVNLNRGDPPADFDGSGQCYLTDNDPGNSNSDVDNGSTTITSRVFAMEDGDTITYRYWFNDIAGGPLSGGDSLRVEIATDSEGSNWVSVRNYTTAASLWRADTITVGTDIPASNSMRIRFTASDIGAQNVVEAGIDAFAANGPPCEDTVEPPDAPTGVTASDGGSCTEVAVNWNASPNATDYEVWRNTVNNSATATVIATGVESTSFSDSTAEPGTTHYYWVKACNEGGCSDFSAEDTGFSDSAPAAVTGLSATLDTVCGAVDLSWNAMPGATGYNIYQNTVDDFGTASLLDTTAATTYRDASGESSLTYFYWVAAVNGCGEGPGGSSAAGSPAPPGDFNLDGFFDGADLQGFVDAMTGDISQFECADLAFPFGTLDDQDVSAMIALLIE